MSVELREDYVMPQWLYNVHVDGVVREINARVSRKVMKQLYDQILFEDNTD